MFDALDGNYFIEKKKNRYMRGRETLDDIQQFLENVIIRCFTSKYTLLPKRREAVAPMDLDLWNLYKSQEDYFKGKFNF